MRSAPFSLIEFDWLINWLIPLLVHHLNREKSNLEQSSLNCIPGIISLNVGFYDYLSPSNLSSFFSIRNFWYREKFYKQEFMRINGKQKDKNLKSLKKEIIKQKFKIYIRRLVFQVLGGIC